MNRDVTLSLLAMDSYNRGFTSGDAQLLWLSGRI